MDKEIYDVIKVIADECSKHPMTCVGCVFETGNDYSPHCLLKRYNPSTLFKGITKKEVYTFDDVIR